MRAHFGHTRENYPQVFIYQYHIWWAVRDSNFLGLRVFSKLLIFLNTRNTENSKATRHRHTLGTHPALFSRFPLRRACGFLRRLPDGRVVDNRLPRHQKFFLSIVVTLVTVLVRRTVTFYVFLCQPLSLRKLCVAHLRAQGAVNENQTGLSLRLRSVLPACVYASCHAQRCARSRTAWPCRSTTSVSPLLQPRPCCAAPHPEASYQVATVQSASVRVRFAH